MTVSQGPPELQTLEPTEAIVPGPREPAPKAERKRAPAYLWVATLAILIPIGIPLVYLLWRVLGAGADAWSALVSTRTLELLANTLLLVVTVTASALALGVAVAWLVTRTDIPARRFWAVTLALPLVVPSYVGALTLLAAFGPGGLITDFLRPLGVSSIPTPTGFVGSWLALSLFTYPFVYLITAPSLRRMDPALEEAARGLGASRSSVFFTIVLPQLRPALAASGLLVALYSLSEFGAVSMLGFDTFTRAIYLNYAGRIDRTPALVLAVVLILLAILILWFEQRTRGRGAYHSRSAKRPMRRIALSTAGRRGALVFLSALFGAAVLVPTVVLGGWLIRGLVNAQSLGPLRDAALGSLVASLLAALAAMAAAVPIAVLAVRYRSRASILAERTVWAIYALPHITVGLAYVFFAANAAPGIYQTLFLLIVAYVAMFLPQASGSAQSSLLQVNPHLEEASRGLGHSHLGTLRRITVPLIRPGLLAGGALVFLTVMKELPATLLLRPTGFETLAVRVWSASTEGFYAAASAAALLLLVISAIPMYFLSVREGRR